MQVHFNLPETESEESENAFDVLLDTIDKSDAQSVKTERSERTTGFSPTVGDNMLLTNPENGLTESEANKRRKIYGENDLSEHKPHHLRKFLTYFTGPIQYVMFAATVLAIYLFAWIDVGVIIALLVMNAIVGFFQEYQADNVVNQLKHSVDLKTTVVRESVKHEILARDLVPGDIVFIDEGTVIPADGKIVERLGMLQVDQSALTGESLAVEKQFPDTLYSGTLIRRGETLMVVTATGDNTFMGQTASLVSKTKKEGHFTKVLSDIGTIQLVLVVLFIFIIWTVAYFKNTSINTLLNWTFALIIVGVPVGLPAVVTTTMAVGAAELAKKQVIVQKLAAIETLAGVDILCSDKTGTLTQNKLTMDIPFCLIGVSPEDIITASALACSRKLKGLDPIDKSILQCLCRFPEVREVVKSYTVTLFQPFDPVSKKVTVQAKDENGQEITCIKGAPHVIAAHVKTASEGLETSDSEIAHYEKQVEDFASRGYRSIGIARKLGNRKWELLGILPLFDPPRYDTAQTIAEARELGLDIKMLTGDSVGIAKETARQLNMGTKIYNVKRLVGFNGHKTTEPHTHAPATLTGSAVTDFVVGADGFAEVFPQHKYMVVEILQRRGHIVAMTGDGVNDAPSLKKADVGIAVEGASQAARSAADIVFLNAGLSTIIDALKSSRRIFHRMRSYVIYRIALSIHLEIFLLITIIFYNTSIDNRLIVFIAIFADLATLAIAYDNATYSQRPTKWDLANLWGMAVVIGILLAIGSLLIFLAFRYVASLQLLLFVQITLTQNWLIFVTRCDGPFWLSFPSWQLAAAVFLVDIIATLFAVFGFFVGNKSSAELLLKIWVFSVGIYAVVSVAYVVMINSNLFQKLLSQPVRKPTLEDLWLMLEREALIHEKTNGKEKLNMTIAEEGV